MNRSIYYFIITLWFVSSCSGGKRLTSSWHDSSETPEKQTSRFSYQYDEETKLFYKLSNDEDNLYISLLADNPQLKRRLLISGIDIWFDSTAKGKVNQGVHLASNAAASRQQPPREMQNDEDRGEGNKMDQMLLKNLTLESIGISFEHVDYEIIKDSLNGQHILFTVALQGISMQNANPNFMSVTIESPVPEIPQQGRRGGGASMGGGMGGGSGMRGGGGGGRGMGGGGRSKGGGQGGLPLGNQAQEIQIKIKKLQLATKS